MATSETRIAVDIYSTLGTFNRYTKVSENVYLTEKQIKGYLRGWMFRVYRSYDHKLITRENINSLLYTNLPIPMVYVQIELIPEAFSGLTVYEKKTTTVDNTTKTYYTYLTSEPSDYKTAYTGDNAKYFKGIGPTQVTGTTAPTWAPYTYYSKQGTTGSEYYILTTSAPSDWSSTYTNYYTAGTPTSISAATPTAAPTWAADTYFKKISFSNSYIHTVLTEKPSDWDTAASGKATFNNYYRQA